MPSVVYDRFLEWENNINNLLNNSEGNADRFKLLSEASFEGICIHDQGVILDANQQFCDMFGYTLDEIQGLDCFNLIAPQSQEAVRGYISSGHEGPYESYSLRKDGSTFPTEVRVREFREDGKVFRFAVFRDLSLMKQAEDELKASEQRFKRLSEATFEGIVIHDYSHFIEANQQFLDMFGYTQAEIEEIDGYDLIAPDYIEITKKQKKSQSEAPYEVECKRKDGSIFPAEFRAKGIVIDDVPFRIVAVRDLTERKEMERQIAESEKRYRELYEHSPIALYRTRISDGKLLECNQALVALFGYDSKEEFQTTTNALSQYVNCEDREVLLKKLEKDKRVEGFQIQLKGKDGQVIWVEDTVEIFPEQGYIEGAMQDITASKVLTPTEKKVLRLVIEGMGNKQIARTLKRSVRTVEDHRSHVMQKLQADNIVELLQKAKSLRSESK